MNRSAASLALVLCVAVSAHSPAQTLDDVLQQHRLGAELVASVSFEFREYAPGQTERAVASGRYHRDGRGVVVEQASDPTGFLPRIVIRNGIIHSFTRETQPADIKWAVGVNAVKPDSRQSRPDVPEKTLFSLLGSGGRTVHPVAEFCQARRDGLQAVRTEDEGGVRYAVVVLRYPDDPEGDRGATATRELWFDTTRNYLLARSVEQYSTAPGGKRVFQVDQFVQPAPRVFFPAVVRCTTRRTADEPVEDYVSFRTNKVAVNGPVPNALLDTTIPPSALVTDSVAGKQYRTGSDGKSVGPPTPLARVPALPNPAGPSRRAADAPAPTSHDAGSWTRFVFPAGAACLLAGAVIWAVRRWQSPSHL